MKKIVIVLLCVFSILIGYIIFDKSDGVGGLREDISLEIEHIIADYQAKIL